jgi:hypothetical protein
MANEERVVDQSKEETVRQFRISQDADRVNYFRDLQARIEQARNPAAEEPVFTDEEMELISDPFEMALLSQIIQYNDVQQEFAEVLDDARLHVDNFNAQFHRNRAMLYDYAGLTPESEYRSNGEFIDAVNAQLPVDAQLTEEDDAMHLLAALHGSNADKESDLIEFDDLNPAYDIERVIGKDPATVNAYKQERGQEIEYLEGMLSSALKKMGVIEESIDVSLVSNLYAAQEKYETAAYGLQIFSEELDMLDSQMVKAVETIASSNPNKSSLLFSVDMVPEKPAVENIATPQALEEFVMPPVASPQPLVPVEEEQPAEEEVPQADEEQELPQEIDYDDLAAEKIAAMQKNIDEYEDTVDLNDTYQSYRKNPVMNFFGFGKTFRLRNAYQDRNTEFAGILKTREDYDLLNLMVEKQKIDRWQTEADESLGEARGVFRDQISLNRQALAAFAGLNKKQELPDNPQVFIDLVQKHLDTLGVESPNNKLSGEMKHALTALYSYAYQEDENHFNYFSDDTRKALYDDEISLEPGEERTKYFADRTDDQKSMIADLDKMRRIFEIDIDSKDVVTKTFAKHALLLHELKTHDEKQRIQQPQLEWKQAQAHDAIDRKINEAALIAVGDPDAIARSKEGLTLMQRIRRHPVTQPIVSAVTLAALPFVMAFGANKLAQPHHHHQQSPAKQQHVAVPDKSGKTLEYTSIKEINAADTGIQILNVRHNIPDNPLSYESLMFEQKVRQDALEHMIPDMIARISPATDLSRVNSEPEVKPVSVPASVVQSTGATGEKKKLSNLEKHQEKRVAEPKASVVPRAVKSVAPQPVEVGDTTIRTIASATQKPDSTQAFVHDAGAEAQLDAMIRNVPTTGAGDSTSVQGDGVDTAASAFKAGLKVTAGDVLDNSLVNRESNPDTVSLQKDLSGNKGEITTATPVKQSEIVADSGVTVKAAKDAGVSRPEGKASATELDPFGGNGTAQRKYSADKQEEKTVQEQQKTAVEVKPEVKVEAKAKKATKPAKATKASSNQGMSEEQIKAAERLKEENKREQENIREAKREGIYKPDAAVINIGGISGMMADNSLDIIVPSTKQAAFIVGIRNGHTATSTSSAYSSYIYKMV